MLATSVLRKPSENNSPFVAVILTTIAGENFW